MTVGVAAVAGRDRNDRRADRGVPTEAIVLVADRRLTYSAGNTVAETWVPKIRGIIGQGATVRTTWSALFAGDGSLVDEIKAELTGNKANDALHEADRPALEDVAAAVSAAVETVWQRGYDAYVYQPFGLTRDLVVRRARDPTAVGVAGEGNGPRTAIRCRRDRVRLRPSAVWFRRAGAVRCSRTR